MNAPHFVYAQWCKSANVGDALMPLLVEKLIKRGVVYNRRGPRLLLGGSILNWGDERCVAWGPGIADASHEVNPKMRITAVRGPLSRERALACGAVVPEVYGDPALLLPRVFPRMIGAARAVGLVPHFIHYEMMKRLYGDACYIVDVTQPLEAVLAALWSCETVISTSLHGLILADAYGIPSGWASVPSNPIGGDKVGTKFLDHFAAVGKDTKEPLELPEHKRVDNHTLCGSLRFPAMLPDTKLDALTNALHEAVRLLCDST